MRTPPRLTPDATYQGRLLTAAQYKIHLAMLRRALALPSRLLFAAEAEGDLDNHVAWCALAQAGIISDHAKVLRTQNKQRMPVPSSRSMAVDPTTATQRAPLL